jgi:hypothetical protein
MTSKKNNKKGVFYTIIVIMFLALTIITIYGNDSYQSNLKKHSIETRINAMNDFINDFHNDVHRATKISATRSLIAMEDYVVNNEEFFQSKEEMEEAFREVFYQGTLYSSNISIMEDADFETYQQKVSASAHNVNMEFYAIVTEIRLLQYDPWNIGVEIDANISLHDYGGLASWQYNKTFMTIIPISGLRDPVYSLNTDGKIQNIIVQSNASYYINTSTNETTNLEEHLSNSRYALSENAPSFLMRFYNDISPDPNGIESMVNLDMISDQGISIDTKKPVIDYRYFSGSEDADICDVEGMPSWFKMRSEDISRYDIDMISYSSCP